MAVIWIIDSDQWPRALLRAELIERGFDAVGYIEIADAIDSLPWRPPDAIVVDLRGQPMPQVAKLLKIGVPVVVVGAETEMKHLPQGAWAELLRRPV
ncbi:MAG: hypothetical protein ACXV7D_17185, partial [Thermoanaerobaculia bacterium]